MFDDGPLEGQTGSGTYEVDGPAIGPYLLYFANTGLLELDVVIDGVVFSVSDDNGSPKFPGIWVFENKVKQLDYDAAIDSPGGPKLNFFIHPNDGISPINYIHFTPQSGGDSYGYFTSFVLLSSEPGGIKNYVPGSGGIGGFKFEPKAPSSPSVNRDLAARARKYGVSVSELFSSRDRGRCTRNCEADGRLSEQQQR